MHGKGYCGVIVYLRILPLKSANINLMKLRLNICMNKQLERYLICVLVFILIGLSGCVPKQKSIQTKEPTTPTTMETIGQLEAIGTVLGCLFDPTPCQKASKKLQEELDNGNSQ